MKLYLDGAQPRWQPERYHYAAEQMMLTLFPGEKPEYLTQPPRTLEGERAAACFYLTAEGDTAVLEAQVAWQGAVQTARSPFPAGDLDLPPRQVYHTVQHALKMAFYRAGTALLGHEPPWGALTGVRPVKLPTQAMRAGATREEAEAQLREEYRVSPRRAALAAACAQESLDLERSLSSSQVSIYVGIPFCPTRCAYCSFVSADVGRALKLLEPYLDALEREIQVTGEVLREAGRKVRTLYVGGGTPTTLSAPQLHRLLSALEGALDLTECQEITVEAGRPDTITREKLEALRAHGVGRVSINPQTLEDEVLRAIGRRHTARETLEAYDLARQIGFEAVNMDLIAGLPRDSLEGFTRTLEQVLALGPENVTVHTLALKRGSELTLGGGALPGGEETAQMLERSLDALEGAGYRPYYLYRQKYMSGALENVGWTVPGKSSAYNIIMMEELQSVISLGGGGVTKLVEPAAGRLERLSNPKYPQDYLSGLDKVLEQKKELGPRLAL